MLKVCIKRRAMFAAVIEMLYAGWMVEEMRGNYLTLRLPVLPHPYR
jgi:hypothetical protein